MRAYGKGTAFVKVPHDMRFRRGDVNGDGEVGRGVTDAVQLLKYLFIGKGSPPPCLAAADVNGDGRVIGQVGDAIYLMRHIFLGGPSPVAPYPECGPGELPSDLSLGCEEQPRDCR